MRRLLLAVVATLLLLPQAAQAQVRTRALSCTTARLAADSQVNSYAVRTGFLYYSLRQCIRLSPLRVRFPFTVSGPAKECDSSIEIYLAYYGDPAKHYRFPVPRTCRDLPPNSVPPGF